MREAPGDRREARLAALSSFGSTVSRLSSLVFLEEGFQYALGGDCIEPGLQPRAARAGVAQHSRRLVRSEPLINQFGAHAEAALQALCEAAGEFADRVLAPVSVRGAPDHEQCRPPLHDQPLDRGKSRAGFRNRDGGKGMREPDFEVTHRDADALGAKVERQDRPRRGVRREA